MDCEWCTVECRETNEKGCQIVLVDVSIMRPIVRVESVVLPKVNGTPCQFIHVISPPFRKPEEVSKPQLMARYSLLKNALWPLAHYVC